MTDDRSYYRDFGITKVNKNFLDKQKLANLFKTPKKDKGPNEAHFTDAKPGAIVQADLLFLPNDRGYRYLLVTVDNASRATDAEPLKSKTADVVLTAFKKIFDRGIVKRPTYRLEVDSGTEFKGVVSKYFEDHAVNVRVAQPARHRQQALVERKNQTIGEALFKGMTWEQLESGEISTAWLQYLPDILKAINKKKMKKPIKVPDKPLCKDDSCEILDIGTKVRVQLDAPRETTGEKLAGRFRKSDIRWNPKIREIKQILIKSGSPVLYLLDGNDTRRKLDFSAAYTKNQLQVVPKSERTFPKEKIQSSEQLPKKVVEKDDDEIPPPKKPLPKPVSLTRRSIVKPARFRD